MSQLSTDLKLDLEHVPFSRFGSYLAFSYLPESDDRPAGLYVRTVRGLGVGRPPMQELFLLQLIQNGRAISATYSASPATLRLESGENLAEIGLPEPAVVQVRCNGVGLRFSMQTSAYDNAIPRGAGRWQVILSEYDLGLVFSPLQGQLAVDAPWNGLRSARVELDLLPDEQTGIAECAIEEFLGSWQSPETSEPFETGCGRVETAFADWLGRIPAVPAEFAQARDLAAYINWSCVVKPAGHLVRPAMFMSKNWMASVWNWDSCFNAMALSLSHPSLAWDQLMLMFDLQDVSGALPDFANDRHLMWSFSKPPVQGWALRWMMDQGFRLSPNQLQQVYRPLCGWTKWWFNYRDDDGDGLPQYNHGNDSGWDNGTVFVDRPPVKSPDLPALLVIQMEFLAHLAKQLGREVEAVDWWTRSQQLLELLLERFWRGDHFVAIRVEDGAEIESESLLLFVPIILGNRLPPAVRASLVAGLQKEGRFLTPHGLASEALSSSLFRPDAYWRGPIWGAPNLMIVDGLLACGETEVALDIAQRFCRTAARGGMAENYHALTGAPLCDRGYTWTASVFLMLAHILKQAETKHD